MEWRGQANHGITRRVRLAAGQRSYGSDIGAKFYVGTAAAVRGTFSGAGSGGKEGDLNVEKIVWKLNRKRQLFANPYRPEGHPYWWPLWRLDKLMGLAYHDANQESCIEPPSDSPEDK